MSKKVLWEEARTLRKDGKSLAQIASLLHVSKGSVSAWVRDIQISEDKKKVLFSHTEKALSYARSCASRKKKEMKAERDAIALEEANKEWETLKRNPFFMYGLALYIGEGSKMRGILSLVNYCPDVVKKSKEFFILIGAEKKKIRYTLNLHEGCCEANAKEKWASILGINISQFSRTVRNKTCIVLKEGETGKFPLGGCRIDISDTHLKQKLLRWIELSFE